MIASLHKLVNLVANSQKSIQGKRLLRQVLSPLYVKWSVAVTSKNCRLKCWLPFLEFCNLYWLLTFFSRYFCHMNSKQIKHCVTLTFSGMKRFFCVCVPPYLNEWDRLLSAFIFLGEAEVLQFCSVHIKMIQFHWLLPWNWWVWTNIQMHM